MILDISLSTKYRAYSTVTSPALSYITGQSEFFLALALQTRFISESVTSSRSSYTNVLHPHYHQHLLCSIFKHIILVRL